MVPAHTDRGRHKAHEEAQEDDAHGHLDHRDRPCWHVGRHDVPQPDTKVVLPARRRFSWLYLGAFLLALACNLFFFWGGAWLANRDICAFSKTVFFISLTEAPPEKTAQEKTEAGEQPVPPPGP